jgi:hypothetical protein
MNQFELLEEKDDGSSAQQEESYILQIPPGESEKNTVFAALLELRNDASFCDVAFLVHGTLFRAHKIVVRLVEHS